MNNRSDTFPDLMHRVTADLEPESTDLLERAIHRGKALRRRRTAVRAAAGTGAVLAAAVVAVGSAYVLQGDPDRSTPFAGTPAASTAAVTSANTVTPEQTLQTLKALLPDDLRVSRPQLHQDTLTGTIDVSILIDDGKGASELQVQIGSGFGPIPVSCADKPGRCHVRRDGSAVTTGGSRPGKPDPSGLLVRSVIIQHANDTTIAIANTNTTSSTTTHPTRPQPVFSHAQLTRIADSKLWKFPPAPTRSSRGR